MMLTPEQKDKVCDMLQSISFEDELECEAEITDPLLRGFIVNLLCDAIQREKEVKS